MTDNNGNEVETVSIGNLGGGSVGNIGIMPDVSNPQIVTNTGTNYTDQYDQSGKEPRVFIKFWKRILMFFNRPVMQSNYVYNFISRIVTTYEDRYWSLIKVNENGQVYFKLFRGWWGGRFIYKFGIRRETELYWDSIPPREKLEATLGATYLCIEGMIKKDLEKRTSIKNIKELCKTDPDNLKMIAELDKLDKGTQVDDTKQDAGVLFASSFRVAGSGMYHSPDPK